MKKISGIVLPENVPGKVLDKVNVLNEKWKYKRKIQLIVKSSEYKLFLKCSKWKSIAFEQ